MCPYMILGAVKGLWRGGFKKTLNITIACIIMYQASAPILIIMRLSRGRAMT